MGFVFSTLPFMWTAFIARKWNGGIARRAARPQPEARVYSIGRN
jgi:hypothetical protein